MQFWKNMKSFRVFAVLFAVCVALSCGRNKTVINGVVTDGADKRLTVKVLELNYYRTLDTVRTDAAGAFRFCPEIKKGNPEFIYIFYGDRRIASLLLDGGDNVRVETDTLGAYSVFGSEESQLLQNVENSYASFIRDMSRILLTESTPDAALSRRFVEYYRDRMTYVMTHSHSLTVVPVLFQQVNETLPVFSQPTDGIMMRTICDSLRSVYPESRYVAALEAEAVSRMNAMELGNRIAGADVVGYIDIDLPGMDGTNIKLSEVDAPVIMLYFWASTAQQKMFNMDALIPIYNEFHPRGLEIYAVSLDSDKSAWAAAVRNQNLQWVNVCDIRSAYSPYVSSYGVTDLPMAWFIVNGEIDPDARVSDAESIRQYLRRKL